MDPSTFPLNWFKNITVSDELHVTAIDNLLIGPGQLESNLAGIGMLNNRWVPIEGNHSIMFSDDSHIKAHCTINDENERSYKIETSGNPAIKAIYRLLNAIRIKIVNDAIISAIDNFIITEGGLVERGGYIADVVPAPIDGIYTLTTKDKDGYMIAKRETDDDKKTYVIDLIGKFYDDKLKTIINGDANRIRVVNCSIVNHQINVRVMNKPPLDRIFLGQRTIVDYAISTYRLKNNKNVTILVSGAPGLGKSTIAFIIAQRIKCELGVDPYLIKGFNVMSEEIQYHPIIGHYSPKNDCPIVLLLDEFDLAMKRADKPDDDDSENRFQMSNLAIASNKTNLNGFLDSINDESFLITVATTNMPIDDLNENFGVYCRKGRFDKHFEMISKDKTTVLEPN